MYIYTYIGDMTGNMSNKKRRPKVDSSTGLGVDGGWGRTVTILYIIIGLEIPP
jgi:hypothetical protein